MVSGIPTASGYEERIRFSEMEVVDRGANDEGLSINIPKGHDINGWDVNVAAVRTRTVKRHVRYHTHAEFLLRVKQAGKPEIYVGRRFGEFARMHKRLRVEMPGKVLPPMPRKNKSHAFYSSKDNDDDDDDSVSSASTHDAPPASADVPQASFASGLRSYIPSFGGGHRRNASKTSPLPSPRASMDAGSTTHLRSPSTDTAPSSPRHSPLLYREDQRVSLRAYLRSFLHNEQIAQSQAMLQFLTADPIQLNEEELIDVQRRIDMDERRVEEQRRFYEIASQRAQELDIHMEKFRRDMVESSECRSMSSSESVANVLSRWLD